jgi:hypothetical protein
MTERDRRFRPTRRWMSALLALAIVFDADAAVHALGTATADAPPAPATATATIDPVFDCFAANSAWGLTYSGKVVDRSGRIWTYRRRGTMLPTAAHDQQGDYFKAADLARKHAGATASGQVDAEALARHAVLAVKAADGRIERSDTGVRDAGTSECHAYLADAARQRYRDVELGSDGGVADRRVVNDAPEAKALIDWLRSIGVAR